MALGVPGVSPGTARCTSLGAQTQVSQAQVPFREVSPLPVNSQQLSNVAGVY